MTPKEAKVGIDHFRDLLAYDPETGLFRWVSDGGVTGWRNRADRSAGSLDNQGYIRIRFGGIKYSAHRLAWLFAHGRWPEEGVEIDHINGDRADNRIANLRLASKGQNQGNRRRARHNSTGFKGVMRKKNRFVAAIRKDGVRKNLGAFETAEAAHAAYVAAARELHGEFARAQ